MRQRSKEIGLFALKMSIFQRYAKFYDILYQDKDYQSECDFLEKVIKRYSLKKVKDILSLGCGTANHDIILAKRGFKITGIDKSEEMLNIARKKARESNLDIEFKLADIQKFELNKKFDLAVAMFNIIGYQTKNEMMEKTLQNVAKALKKNGLFVFDCWYGPAILKDRPANRVKKIKGEQREIIRTTKQRLDIENNIIDINFEGSKIEGGAKRIVFQENHKMRFWYLPELKYFLQKQGFELIKVCNFLDLESEISENNWNIFVIAKKI